MGWVGEEGGDASVSALLFYSSIHLYKELTPPTPTLHTAIVFGLSDKGPSRSLSLLLSLVGSGSGWLAQTPCLWARVRGFKAPMAWVWSSCPVLPSTPSPRCAAAAVNPQNELFDWGTASQMAPTA